jgi:hypothetical protein
MLFFSFSSYFSGPENPSFTRSIDPDKICDLNSCASLIFRFNKTSNPPELPSFLIFKNDRGETNKARLYYRGNHITPYHSILEEHSKNKTIEYSLRKRLNVLQDHSLVFSKEDGAIILQSYINKEINFSDLLEIQLNKDFHIHRVNIEIVVDKMSKLIEIENLNLPSWDCSNRSNVTLLLSKYLPSEITTKKIFIKNIYLFVPDIDSRDIPIKKINFYHVQNFFTEYFCIGNQLILDISLSGSNARIISNVKLFNKKNQIINYEELLPNHSIYKNNNHEIFGYSESIRKKKSWHQLGLALSSILSIIVLLFYKAGHNLRPIFFTLTFFSFSLSSYVFGDNKYAENFRYIGYIFLIIGLNQYFKIFYKGRFRKQISKFTFFKRFKFNSPEYFLPILFLVLTFLFYCLRIKEIDTELGIMLYLSLIIAMTKINI